MVRCFLVLVGKMNLEVRPVAINKGEIVKRLMYSNPNAEFVFCAGDDKVRLNLFPQDLWDLSTYQLRLCVDGRGHVPRVGGCSSLCFNIRIRREHPSSYGPPDIGSAHHDQVQTRKRHTLACRLVD